MSDPTDVADVAARLAEFLPGDDLQALTEATIEGPHALAQLKARAPSGTVRSACDDLARVLEHGADPAFVAGALSGAARVVRRGRERSAIDVVWTGPPSQVTSSRLTSAVVIDLIDSAHEEILLISFANYPPAALREALERAVEREVFVTVLLERHRDNPNFSGSSDLLAGIRLRRLAWPIEKRPAGAALHAKVMVIDRSVALVGSANLTGHALDKNIECGVLLRGGEQPARIHAHISSLLDSGGLVVA